MMISLLITFYNSSIHEIDRCLNSIVNQTTKPFECIIMDDCSKVNSDYIKKICDQNKFIYLRNEVNQGVCVSRNLLISKCTGKYFAFVDGDDYIEPNYIEKITDQKSDADIIFFRMKSENGVCKKYKNTKNYLAIKSIAACEKCFKTSLIKFNRINFTAGPHLYEDMYFSYKAYFHAKSVHYINKGHLYNYISRNDSASHTADVKQCLEAGIFYFNKLIKDIHLNYSDHDVQFIYILIFSHLVIKSAFRRDFKSIKVVKIPIKVMWNRGIMFLLLSIILKLLLKLS